MPALHTRSVDSNAFATGRRGSLALTDVTVVAMYVATRIMPPELHELSAMTDGVALIWCGF